MQPAPGKFRFGPFFVDTAARQLVRDGNPVHLAPKSWDLLLVLVQNPGRVLEKDDLLRAVWPDVIVEEGNLTQHISLLRKVLGHAPDGGPYIETVPKAGYKFRAPVSKPRMFSRRNQAVVALVAAILACVAALYWLGRNDVTQPGFPKTIWVLPFEIQTNEPELQSVRDLLQTGILEEINAFNVDRVLLAASPGAAPYDLLCKGRLRRANDQFEFELELYNPGQRTPHWHHSTSFAPGGQPAASSRARSAIHAYLHELQRASTRP